MKKVLVLGAGLVSRPHVAYLLDQPDVGVTVATRTVSKAEKIIADNPKGTALALNVNDDSAVEELISQHDVVVSLLPYTYHVKVAKFCIKHKKHMVTTSYVSSAMRELDEKAKDAGVVIINEIGVDPGIDHMSAMKIIDTAKSQGGKIKSFKSYCGGLPAPEANTNPWGYKFSWSPRGVVAAGKNPARYLQDGKTVEILGTDLFDTHWMVNIPGFGELEAYTNRDSLPYIDIYNISDVDTMFRGTLRYPEWSIAMKKVGELGLLDDEKIYELSGLSYAEFMKAFVEKKDVTDLKQVIADQIGLLKDSIPIYMMDWLGLFGDEKIGLEKGTAMDVFCKILFDKLRYKAGERDMLVMHHEFVVEFPDKTQHITSTMIDFGIPNGDTSMSRTVGLPSAIAVKMILQGKITEPGIHIPVKPYIYLPILEELKNLGITFIEKYEDL
jgi:saccharopine dehydrogenase (NADP+, L-glutamate forming)/spermidine synthase